MKKILKEILVKQIPVFIVLLIFVALNEYIFTLPSKILGRIIDMLYDIEANIHLINKNLLFLLLSAIGILFTRAVWKTCIGFSTRQFERKLKDKIFTQFMKLNLSSVQNTKNGELMSYLTKDVGEVRGFLYRTESHVTRIVLTSIIVFITMKNVNTALSLAIVGIILFTMVISLILKKRIELSFKKAQAEFTRVSEYVQESTDAIRTTKAYFGEQKQLDKFIELDENLKNSNIKVDKNATLLDSTVDVCFGLCIATIILFGSRLVLAGKMTIGDLVAFSGYVDLLFVPVYWLPGVLSKFQRAKISYGRLDKVFSLNTEPISLEDSKNFKNKIDGDIEIKDLTFTYPSKEYSNLKNINISIKKGHKLGIIGTIGSGKTTLANLLLRLYDVPRGTITIDGKDVNDIDLDELRNSICYITQDNFLFSTTIENNIALFKDEDEKKVFQSVIKSVFKEDLDNMKDGLQTVIGERGIDLSGGQKQRVVIARSFLLNNNILIFDDCFSALDNKTEEKLLSNLYFEAKDKTCIIISNRISDVKNSDEIIVLDKGEIVERGKHDDLIENGGLYAKFYQKQSSN